MCARVLLFAVHFRPRPSLYFDMVTVTPYSSNILFVGAYYIIMHEISQLGIPK